MKRRNPARLRAIEARLSRETTIWLATTRHDGRPHLVPVWYVWLEGKIYLSTGTDTQKYLNMYRNQSVSLALPDTQNVIIIEGEAHAANHESTTILADYFYNKYEWDFRYDETTQWRLIEITPYKILAWGDGYDQDGTRVL